MPIYKGAVEVTSGNLYKGSTEIENAYKGSDSLFVNEITVTLPSSVTDSGITWSVNTTSFTGTPGSTSSSFTLTASAGGSLNKINGTADVSMDISGVGVGVSQSTSNTGGLDNSSTITCTFTFPNNGGNATLIVRNMTNTTYLGIVNLTSDTNVNSFYASCNNTAANICGNPSNGWTGGAGTVATNDARWNFTGDTPPASSVSISLYSSDWTTGSYYSSGVGGTVSASVIAGTGGSFTESSTWDSGPNGNGYASISISGYYLTGVTTVKTTTYSGYNVPGFPDCTNCPGNP